MHLNQFSDNGKTIGCINGKVVSGICVGGLDFVTHDGNYKSYQPTADARYRVQKNWSIYGQFATGNVIPPSSVFDVKNAQVKTTPDPTFTKSFQVGSVYKTNRFTLDADFYLLHAGNAYASAPDPVTGEPVRSEEHTSELQSH